MHERGFVLHEDRYYFVCFVLVLHVCALGWQEKGEKYEEIRAPLDGSVSQTHNGAVFQENSCLPLTNIFLIHPHSTRHDACGFGETGSPIFHGK